MYSYSFKKHNFLIDAVQWPLQGEGVHITWCLFLNCFTFQNLAPVYEQVADAFSHAKDKVIIAKVDADGEGKPLGSKYGVTGYPSTYT